MACRACAPAHPSRSTIGWSKPLRRSPIQHHRPLARGALRVGHHAVGGHGHDQRRKLGVADDVDVIAAGRAGAVDRDVDRDHVRGVAELSMMPLERS